VRQPTRRWSTRELAQLRGAVNEAWEARHLELEQDHDLQLFLRSAARADAWLDSQDAHHAPQRAGRLGRCRDLADSTARRAHDIADQAKMDSLAELAQRMAEDRHRSTDGIQARLAALVSRRQDLMQRCAAYADQLEQARRLHAFVNEAADLQRWIAGKVPQVGGKAFADNVPLPHKLQKYEAFKAEIVSSSGRFDEIIRSGKALLDGEKYASDSILPTLTALQAAWDDLGQRSAAAA